MKSEENVPVMTPMRSVKAMSFTSPDVVRMSVTAHSGIRRVRSFEQHLRETGDAGERCVDFVRDTGREKTDGCHLL